VIPAADRQLTGLSHCSPAPGPPEKTSRPAKQLPFFLPALEDVQAAADQVDEPAVVGEDYELPHARRDGSTHLLLDPRELIEKLSVLIPSPRFHTLRFHGVFAPHSGWCVHIIPKPAEAVEGEVGPAGQAVGAGDGSTSYHPDGLGSTVLLTDSSGGQVATYDYDAWGVPAGGGNASAVGNRFRFTGEEVDDLSGRMASDLGV